MGVQQGLSRLRRRDLAPWEDQDEGAGCVGGHSSEAERHRAIAAHQGVQDDPAGGRGPQPSGCVRVGLDAGQSGQFLKQGLGLPGAAVGGLDFPQGPAQGPEVGRQEPPVEVAGDERPGA